MAAALVLSLSACSAKPEVSLPEPDYVTPTAAPEPTAAPTSEPTPEPTPADEYFVISMVGDCTLASSQRENVFETIIDGDMSRPFSGTRQYFEDDYLTIANLECSLSDEPLSGSSTFQFCGDAEKSALRKLLKTGLPLQAQVLVLPHHGSASSLLPEFADSLELDVQRQPARVWAVWLIPFGIAGLLLGFLSWSLYWFQILTAFWCIAAPLLMAGGCLLLMILRYLTCGCALKEDYVLAVNGYLGRRVTMAAYHQIQYVELKQNPLAMLLHLQKGRLHLLAGAGNQIHDLPYFSSKKIDFFRRRLLHSKEQRGYTNPINEKGEQA